MKDDELLSLVTAILHTRPDSDDRKDSLEEAAEIIYQARLYTADPEMLVPRPDEEYTFADDDRVEAARVRQERAQQLLEERAKQLGAKVSTP